MRTPSRTGPRWPAALLAAVLTLLGSAAPAAPADLDAAFGSGGTVVTNLGSTAGTPWQDRAYATALQSDGKIVVAGASEEGSSVTAFSLARYTSTGALDPTFGTGGIVTTAFSAGVAVANAVKIQTDGRIVAAGIAGNGFGLARYNPDGTLDQTFGSGGTVLTTFPGGVASGNAMVIAPDGSIVVAGDLDNGNSSDFALARYTAMGALDTTFGSSGLVTTSFKKGRSTVYAVGVQSDGKIVAAGAVDDDVNANFALARYDTSGNLDQLFGSFGQVTTDFSGNPDYAYAMLIQPDGKIVAGGQAGTTSGSDFGLARYGTDGSLDTTFGSSGKTTTNFDSLFGGSASQAAIGGIALLSGTIVAAGTAGTTNDRFALARYKASGAADTGFGTGGRTVTSIGGVDDEANAIVVQPNAEVVAAGFAYSGSSFDFALARYRGDAVPPSAPQNLAATSSGQPAGAIKLTWQAPAVTGSAPVTAYDVYRGTVSGGETLLTTLGNVLTFTDTGLPDNARYFYEVSAINNAGEGARSNEASATTRGLPTQPTNLTAAGGDGQIALTWSAPSDPGTQPITNYAIFRGTTASNLTLLTTLGNVLSFTDTGLGASVTRYYAVAAINAIGQGPQSSVAHATTNGPPGAPQSVTATGGTNQITVTWLAPASNGGVAITNYDVYAGATAGTTSFLTRLGNVLTFTETGLADNQTRCYAIAAVNTYGDGALSSVSCATTRGLPTAPRALTTAGLKQITLTWTAPADPGTQPITAYRIYRGAAHGTESLLATVGNVTSYTDGSLGNGQRYYYQVSAVNAIGEGPRSVEATASTFDVPSAPRNVKATPGPGVGGVTLSWDAPSSNGGTPVTGYVVYRGTAPTQQTPIATLGDVTTYTDTTGSPATKYYYSVAATNGAGTGSRSGNSCTRAYPWVAQLGCTV